MKKLLAALFALTLATAALSGCANSSAAKTDGGSGGELKTVRIGGITNPFTESAAIAQNLGFFEEELAKAGYQPEYSTFAQAGPALNEALASSAIDFGVYADFPQIVAVSNGIDIRAIAAVNATQHYTVIAHGGAGVKSAKDLEGKNVIATKGTIIQRVFEEWVENDGADISKINILNAVSDVVSVFSSGEADALMSTAIYVASYQERIEDSEIVFRTQEHPEYATPAYIVGRQAYLDENPEAAKAIVRALYRAYKYAAEDAERAYEALATDRAPASLQKAAYGYNPSFSNFDPEITEQQIKSTKETNAFLFEQGLIKAEIDVDKFVDRQYVDAVKGEF